MNERLNGCLCGCPSKTFVSTALSIALISRALDANTRTAKSLCSSRINESLPGCLFLICFVDWRHKTRTSSQNLPTSKVVALSWKRRSESMLLSHCSWPFCRILLSVTCVTHAESRFRYCTGCGTAYLLRFQFKGTFTSLLIINA